MWTYMYVVVQRSLHGRRFSRTARDGPFPKLGGGDPLSLPPPIFKISEIPSIVIKCPQRVNCTFQRCWKNRNVDLKKAIRKIWLDTFGLLQRKTIPLNSPIKRFRY